MRSSSLWECTARLENGALRGTFSASSPSQPGGTLCYRFSVALPHQPKPPSLPGDERQMTRWRRNHRTWLMIWAASSHVDQDRERRRSCYHQQRRRNWENCLIVRLSPSALFLPRWAGAAPAFSVPSACHSQRRARVSGFGSLSLSWR